jgi:hypothetical protein
MILTVATFDESGPELGEGIRHVQEEVVPAFGGAEGLVSGYWVVDRDNGRRLSVTVWRDADAVSAAMPALMARIKETREAAGRGQQAGPTSTARYEVFASLP